MAGENVMDVEMNLAQEKSECHKSECSHDILIRPDESYGEKVYVCHKCNTEIFPLLPEDFF